MYRKQRKHTYTDLLKYMHMLENGVSMRQIGDQFGINRLQLGCLWAKYLSEGPSGLRKKKNVRADTAFRINVVRDIEENHLTLVEASLKYNASPSRISVWRNIAKAQGYDALSVVKPRGRPPKNDMGRPRKKKPEEMTELERLRYENECLRAENALLKKVKALVEAREARLKEIGRKPSKN